MQFYESSAQKHYHAEDFCSIIIEAKIFEAPKP